MKKEIQVKAHTRKTKSGKTVTVKAYTVSRESADSMAKEALKKKKGSGGELQKAKTTKLSQVKDENLKNKLIDYVEKATDGEYSTGKYTWKDTVKALRSFGEGSVRSSVAKKFGLNIDRVNKQTPKGKFKKSLSNYNK